MATKHWILPPALAVVWLMTAGFGVAGGVRCAAHDAQRRCDVAAPALVLTSVITPVGSATPAPQAKPSDKPVPTQKPKATAAPTPRPTPRPWPEATPRPTPRPTARPSLPPAATPSATTAAGAGVITPSSEPVPGQALPGVPEAGPATFPPIVFLPLLLVAAAAVVLVTIGRRRFTPAPEAEGVESVPEVGPEMGAVALLPGLVGPEAARDAHIPRWRRPSVAAARFETTNATIVRAAAAATIAPARLPVVFADTTDPLAERMLVRYDSVPLLDGPDDVLGRTLRELDGGDEVEVLERQDIWARVRTPNGVDGWVPTMTLTTASASAAEELAVAFQTEAESMTPPEEGPPLEVLLEAIVAQRLARQELASDLEAERSPDVLPVAVPARSRSRKKSGEGTVSVTPKPSRTRRAQGGRPAARPS